MKLGFTRSNADREKPLILVLYVDDLFLTGTDPLIHQCKRELASEFEMKDLGLMHYFLGLEVWQRPGEIFLSQGKYIVKLLERFGMVDCKSEWKRCWAHASKSYRVSSTRRGPNVLSEHLFRPMLCSEHFESTHG